MDQGMSNENSKTTEPTQAATDSQQTRRAILTLHGNQLRKSSKRNIK
jgi:hypothetical protein